MKFEKQKKETGVAGRGGARAYARTHVRTDATGIRRASPPGKGIERRPFALTTTALPTSIVQISEMTHTCPGASQQQQQQ